MVAAALGDLRPEHLGPEIAELLLELGRDGGVAPVAYDTAWLARLEPDHPELGGAREILHREQHPDGSWGGPIFYWQDRVVSTLAAVTALRRTGKDRRDEEALRHGVAFLWRGRAPRSGAHDTIAFPLLCASLGSEAVDLGLDVPPPRAEVVAAARRKLLLAMRRPRAEWRRIPLIHSAEALGDVPGLTLAGASLPDGSVGTSPAATIGMLLRAGGEDTSASMRYLSGVASGGLPAVAPIELMEIAWSLDRLGEAGAVERDDPRLAPHLELLWRAWSPERGVGWSRHSPLPDADDTALVFGTLRWGGRPADPGVFAAYEGPDHFTCFPDEDEASVSTNVHVLHALRSAGDGERFGAWRRKALAMVREGEPFFTDKWHASPYYTTSDAVRALAAAVPERVQAAIAWISETQRTDGGWGYHGRSTPEETAYALSALLLWDRTRERVAPLTLRRGAEYLAARRFDQAPPLWIGKSLYAPTRVVRAAVLAALHDYLAWRE